MSQTQWVASQSIKLSSSVGNEGEDSEIKDSSGKKKKKLLPREQTGAEQYWNNVDILQGE